MEWFIIARGFVSTDMRCFPYSSSFCVMRNRVRVHRRGTLGETAISKVAVCPEGVERVAWSPLGETAWSYAHT
jgi:hypothetical protein